MRVYVCLLHNYTSRYRCRDRILALRFRTFFSSFFHFLFRLLFRIRRRRPPPRTTGLLRERGSGARGDSRAPSTAGEFDPVIFTSIDRRPVDRARKFNGTNREPSQQQRHSGSYNHAWLPLLTDIRNRINKLMTRPLFLFLSLTFSFSHSLSLILFAISLDLYTHTHADGYSRSIPALLPALTPQTRISHS